MDYITKFDVFAQSHTQIEILDKFEAELTRILNGLKKEKAMCYKLLIKDKNITAYIGKDYFEYNAITSSYKTANYDRFINELRKFL